MTRNMKNAIKILLLALTCMATRCPDKENENCHTAIGFSNNSEKDLYVRPYDLIHRPSHISEIEHIKGTVQQRYKIYSAEQDNRRATDWFICYERTFRMDSLINLYIFDATVVENTPWETVAKDYLVLKRYELSLADLQRLDWQVTYPPTEAMEDVKQHPPYGSEKGEFNGNTKEAETER